MRCGATDAVFAVSVSQLAISLASWPGRRRNRREGFLLLEFESEAAGAFEVSLR